MKRLLALFILLLSQSCEYATLKYGYYWNPVTILSMAKEAIENNDVDQFSELLSGKTLCVYGSKEGMINLRKVMSQIDQASIEEPKLVSSKYLERPEYIGYYSYFQETHVSKAYNHQGQEVLKVTVLCNFGTDELSKKLVGAPIAKFNTRSCSITGIKNVLNPIKVPEYCIP
jgi:hypothetical protein